MVTYVGTQCTIQMSGIAEGTKDMAGKLRHARETRASTDMSIYCT